MKKDSQSSGIIFDIQKFSIHDGPGIRTTVFLKGCPLRCLWCHNPEGLNSNKEIFFTPSKCIGCGWCFEACPNKCHRLENNQHIFDRENCIICGKCTEKCYAQALELVGREMSVSEVIAEVIKDKSFYETSGGGMTVSGGEPMQQFPFLLELLKAAKKEKIHVCIETSGFAPIKKYGQIVDSVDIFLFDFKESDSEKHREFTGVPLEPILKSLEFLNTRAKDIILRCPIIPGLNDNESHLQKIGTTAESFDKISRVEIEPYHPLGISKSERLGTENPLNHLKELTPEELSDKWIDVINKHTRKPVTR